MLKGKTALVTGSTSGIGLDMARALAAGISIAPGPLFSPQGKYRNCIRLMCAVRWDARVDAALASLGSLASR